MICDVLPVCLPVCRSLPSAFCHLNMYSIPNSLKILGVGLYYAQSAHWFNVFMDSLILVADFPMFAWLSLLFFPLVFLPKFVALCCIVNISSNFCSVDKWSIQSFWWTVNNEPKMNPKENISMILWTISFHVIHEPWSRFVLIFSLVSIHHIFYSSLIFFSVSVALMRAFCLYPSISSPLHIFQTSSSSVFLFFFIFSSILFSFSAVENINGTYIYIYTPYYTHG